MKKLYFASVLACSLAVSASATDSFADQTTSTVNFIAPVDAQGCIITPILLNSSSSESSALSRAEAQALVQVLGSVRAIAAGNVELSVTRNGKNGSVNKAELSGKMGNSYLAAVSVKADAIDEASTDVSTYANAYAIASSYANASWDFRPLNIDESGIGYDFELAAGVRWNGIGYSISESSSQSGAASEGTSLGGISTETTTDLSSTNEATAHVLVDGANINQFEADLSMSGVVMHSVNTKAIAEVLADSYARAYADALATSNANASTLAELYAHLYVELLGITLVNWNPTWPFGQDYDSASDADRESLRAEFRAVATAQAEAIVNFLTSSNLNVNLGVRFENLPGTTDKLEATGNTSAILTCDISKALLSTATAQTQP